MDTAPGLRAPGFPGENFLRMVFSRDTFEQKPIGRDSATALAVQGVVAVVLSLAAAVAAVVPTWRPRQWDPSRVYPALVGLAVIGGILVDQATGGAWNRSVVLAAPCVVCLRRFPVAVLAVTVLVVGSLAALMGHAFFGGLLV